MNGGRAGLPKNEPPPAAVLVLIHHENTIKHRARDELYKDFPAEHHTLGGLLLQTLP